MPDFVGERTRKNYRISNSVPRSTRMEAYDHLYGYQTALRTWYFVTSLVSIDQVQAAAINEMVEKTFEGSLPAFIAAFTKHQKISDAEIDAVQQMIDRYRKGESK